MCRVLPVSLPFSQVNGHPMSRNGNLSSELVNTKRACKGGFPMQAPGMVIRYDLTPLPINAVQCGEGILKLARAKLLPYMLPRSVQGDGAVPQEEDPVA